MATDSTAICNLSLTKMGQNVIDSISGTDTLSVKCNIIYPQARDELLVAGPEKGWKFARRRNRISADVTTITAFALDTSTTTTVTGTHGLVAGDLVVIEGTTSYDGEFEVVSISTTVSFVITATFVADDATGTAKWTSEQYQYRYPMPTNLRMISVQVGGVELTDWTREGVYLLTNMEDEEIDLVYIRDLTDTTLFPALWTKVLVLSIAMDLTYNLTQDLQAAQIWERQIDAAMSKAMAMDLQEYYVEEKSTNWEEVGNRQEVEGNWPSTNDFLRRASWQ